LAAREPLLSRQTKETGLVDRKKRGNNNGVEKRGAGRWGGRWWEEAGTKLHWKKSEAVAREMTGIY